MIFRSIQRCVIQICAGAFLCVFGAVSSLANPNIEHLADKLMEYRLPDGGVLVNKTDQPEGRLVPYFSNLAALGWTEAARVTTNTEKRATYLQATRAWLDWYAAHQNPNGTIYDFEGPVANLQPTGSYDSTDSYAATYAILMLRYYEVSQDKAYLQKKLSSLNGAYDAILLTMDDTGLTYAHPHYAYRFLMDNCEVAAGFAAFQKLYTILGDTQKAARADQDLQKLKAQFAQFYRPEHGAFAYALDPFGNRVGDFSKGYPDAMANLFAMTYLAPSGAESTAFLNKIENAFWDKADSQNFPQWWTWPASICGDAELLDVAATKLLEQANAPTAHSYLVGMAAATFATGVNSIRFPEVVCTWPQLTKASLTAPAAPSSNNLVDAGSSVVITGHKASGTLASGEWQESNVSLPLTFDFKITTSTGYLQTNLVWDQSLDLQSKTGIQLQYEIPSGQSGMQLQVTLIEADGDWWDAPMPATQGGNNSAQLKFADFAANPWGKGGNGKRDLSDCRGIRLQVVNKSDAPISGSVKITSLGLF